MRQVFKKKKHLRNTFTEINFKNSFYTIYFCMEKYEELSSDKNSNNKTHARTHAQKIYKKE